MFTDTVRNSQGLDADAILSAENNTVLDDLITGTTTIVRFECDQYLTKLSCTVQDSTGVVEVEVVDS